MQLETNWINYDGPTGPVSAYLARPSAASGPLPGIIVIQEIWGVDAHIAELTERFAAAGYVAMAPDLIRLGGKTRGDRTRACRAGQGIPRADWRPGNGRASSATSSGGRRSLASCPKARDRGSTRRSGRCSAGSGMPTPTSRCCAPRSRSARPPGMPGPGGGVDRYCLGGGLSLRLACEEPELGAAALYYGSAPAPEQIAQIRCPIRCFYGEDDERLIAGVPELAGALQAAVSTTSPGLPRDSACVLQRHPAEHRIEASRDASARTLAFFAAALDP